MFEVVAAYQSFGRMEIVTDGVAFDVTYPGGGAAPELGHLAVDIAAEIEARRAVDVHLGSGEVPGFLGVYGSIACDESAITLDGTWSPAHAFGFELFVAGALSAGAESAIVDLRAGGRGRVSVTCRNAALHASGAGLWLRPRDSLALSVAIDSCVLHALGDDSYGGGPLVVQGAGLLSVAIRSTIFSRNRGDVDLPGYDPLTYVLERNLVQQPDLVGVGGNITGAPRFVDAPAGDFHLRPDSPARGLGVPAAARYDHEEDPRGIVPDDDTTDVGSDEFYPRYHWFHPRPRLGVPTRLRILGEPGDLALVFAARLAPSSPDRLPVGIGWQLGELVVPQPIAAALIGPEGLAEVPLTLPDALAGTRLRGRGIVTQVRYLTPAGATEFSANAVVVPFSH